MFFLLKQHYYFYYFRELVDFHYKPKPKERMVRINKKSGELNIVAGSETDDDEIENIEDALGENIKSVNRILQNDIANETSSYDYLKSQKNSDPINRLIKKDEEKFKSKVIGQFKSVVESTLLSKYNVKLNTNAEKKKTIKPKEVKAAGKNKTREFSKRR